MLLSTSELGTLVHVPTVCTGCSICELMCSLYHEGAQAPPLTRLQVVNNPADGKRERGLLCNVTYAGVKKRGQYVLSTVQRELQGSLQVIALIRITILIW